LLSLFLVLDLSIYLFQNLSNQILKPLSLTLTGEIFQNLEIHFYIFITWYSPSLVPPIAVREPLILYLAPDKDPGAAPVAESLLVDLCPDCFPFSSPHHIIIGKNTINQQFVQGNIINKKWFSPSFIDPEPEAFNLLGRTKTRVASHPLARDEVKPEGRVKKK